MTDPEDFDIDALLRAQFDGPVPDDGFADRVLRQPRPRRRRVPWPIAAGLVAGVVACWLSLLPTPLLRAGWLDWVHGEWSGAALVLVAAMAGMSLLACWWTAMEPDGR